MERSRRKIIRVDTGSKGVRMIIVLAVLGMVVLAWGLYLWGNRRIGDGYIPEYEAYQTRLHRNHRQ